MNEKNEKEEVKLELTDEQLEAVSGGVDYVIPCPVCHHSASITLEDIRKGAFSCGYCGARILSKARGK